MKPILASKIINCLGVPKKGLMGYINGSIADAKILETRMSILKSKKFVISDNLVKKASEASMSKPSILLDMIQNGLPQFDNIWIEWDESVRQKFYQDYHQERGTRYKEVDYFPEKVGYHICKFTDDLGDSYFLYECWFQIEDSKQFASPPICFVLNNQDPDSFEDIKAKNDLMEELPEYMMVKNENELFAEQLRKSIQLLAPWYALEKFPKDLLKKFTQVDGGIQIDYNKVGKIIDYDKNHEFNCFKDLTKRIETAQGASVHWMVPKESFLKGYTQDEMKHMTESSLDVLVGDARFLIALFGLLNAEITREEVIEPNAKVIHHQFGKAIPRNDYKVLHVDLSDNQVRKIYKSKYTGIKKRQHERRGHWRHFKNGKKTWIRNCLAGDPNLGIIYKDYNFTKEE